MENVRQYTALHQAIANLTNEPPAVQSAMEFDIPGAKHPADSTQCKKALQQYASNTCMRSITCSAALLGFHDLHLAGPASFLLQSKLHPVQLWSAHEGCSLVNVCDKLPLVCRYRQQLLALRVHQQCGPLAQVASTDGSTVYVEPSSHGSIDAADMKPKYATHQLDADSVQVTVFMPPECPVPHMTSVPMTSQPDAKDDACGKMVQALVRAGALSSRLQPIGLQKMRVRVSLV